MKVDIDKIANIEEFVKNYGMEVFTKEIIKRLIPCDDEAFEMYRY